MGSMKHLLGRNLPVLFVLAAFIGYVVYDLSHVDSPDFTELSWTQPLETEGDEVLPNLAGYNIHCW